MSYNEITQIQQILKTDVIYISNKTANYNNVQKMLQPNVQRKSCHFNPTKNITYYIASLFISYTKDNNIVLFSSLILFLILMVLTIFKHLLLTFIFLKDYSPLSHKPWSICFNKPTYNVLEYVV